jgi:hypothetical protein
MSVLSGTGASGGAAATAHLADAMQVEAVNIDIKIA